MLQGRQVRLLTAEQNVQYKKAESLSPPLFRAL